MIRLLARLGLLFPLALCGCASPLAVGEKGSASYWVPGAREVFTTIGADTLYTVVPDAESDMLIREVGAGEDRRLTWIVRLPRRSPMDRAVEIGTASTAHETRAWLLEEVAGTPAALVPASGSVVLHGRTADSTRASVVLEAELDAAQAGRLDTERFFLTHRGAWIREIREPIVGVPKETRSGTDPPDEYDLSDPYRDDTVRPGR